MLLYHWNVGACTREHMLQLGYWDSVILDKFEKVLSENRFAFRSQIKILKRRGIS